MVSTDATAPRRMDRVSSFLLHPWVSGLFYVNYSGVPQSGRAQG